MSVKQVTYFGVEYVRIYDNDEEEYVCIYNGTDHGLGGNIVAFEIVGGIESGRQFLNKIKMCSLSANLGDTRTIVTHPASTTHAKLSEDDRLEVGITDGLVRISVGLEHVDDVIGDLEQALEG